MLTIDDMPNYGVSDRYIGEPGEHYHKSIFHHLSADRYYLSSKFLKFVNPTDTVLDFGSGIGDALVDLPCSRRIAVDVNPESLKVCRERGFETHSDLTSVPEQVAHVAISNHCLEHVPYPIEALRQLKRTIRPGGTLVVIVPINDWRAKREQNWQPGDINHHLHTWTPLLLGNSLVEAGYDVTPQAIRVVNRTRPGRFTEIAFTFLPRPAFRLLCRLWAIMVRRREIEAVVTVDFDPTTD